MKRLSINPGDRFGKLTVIEEMHKNGYRMIRCKCDCGKETLVYSSHLLSGATKSCGCSRNSGIKPGDRFGMLTVIEEVEKKNGKRRFKCKCDCGKEVYPRVSQLLHGYETCGCIYRMRKVYPGEMFSMLRVIEEIEKKDNHRMVRCKCICGNEKITRLHNLLAGYTKSCGCIYKKDKYKWLDNIDESGDINV